MCKHVDICGEGLCTGGTLVHGVPWVNGNDSIGLAVDMTLGAASRGPLRTTWLDVRIHQTMAG